MTQLRDIREDLPLPIAGVAETARLSRFVATNPVAIFVLLSALFAPLTIVLTPPLRGPDEPSHFIRAYGLSTGEIIPSTTDSQGRKGIFVPAELQHDMQLYEQALGMLYRDEDQKIGYRDVLAEYARLRAETAPNPGVVISRQAPDRQVFVLYAGSEGYSPVPYLPYLPGLVLARALQVDFVDTIYLMRAGGLAMLTAIVAFAIAIVPQLQWAFVLIGLLPSALFSRVVLSADGGALALAMVVAALLVRGAYGVRDGNVWTRALWLTACVLSKPPQIAFILLEAMRHPLGQIVRHWRTSVLVVGPAAMLAIIWTAASSADVAVWRIVDGSTLQAEHVDPLWKLRFLIEQPWHFPVLLAGTYHYLDDYWLQLIGVLGWLDIKLRGWVYPVLSIALLAVCAAPFELGARAKHRLAVVAALTALAYGLAVFVTFYMVWTSLDSNQIEGVQGRYFVVVLPLVAIALAGALKRGFSEAIRRRIATAGATLSGLATIDAVLRADWKVSLLPI